MRHRTLVLPPALKESVWERDSKDRMQPSITPNSLWATGSGSGRSLGPENIAVRREKVTGSDAAADPRRQGAVLQDDIVSWFQWRRTVRFAKHFPQIYFYGPAHL
jgi:hypothetical protein